MKEKEKEEVKAKEKEKTADCGEKEALTAKKKG